MSLQPGELGIPAPLDSWRPEQAHTFERMLVSGRRFEVAALPTGIGKSLLGVGYAKLMGGRTVFLTSTKGLQDQYLRDFSPAGLVDVRGMGNYPCRMLAGGGECDEGPCLDGESCQWRETGCHYYDQVGRAAGAELALTNYAFWFQHARDEAPVLGPRDLLVCDEAHLLVDELAAAAGARFTAKEVKLTRLMSEWTAEEWRRWGLENALRARQALAAEGLKGWERRALRGLLGRFWKVAQLTDDWAWDVVPSRHVTFEPIVPRQYAEGLLWRGTPKVVLLSATIRPEHMRELGVPEAEYTFHESDSPFPADRRPIYWLEIGHRITAKTSDLNLEFWVNKIDQVMDKRLDRKGIIHTVSYARAKFLQKHSRHAGVMLTHDWDDLRETVERFKRAKATAILVSPIVHTGYNFPYEEAEWQVVSKVPFPDTRTGIARARQARDKSWVVRQAVTTLVQMAGRVVRAKDDLGETIITDDSWKWLWSRYRPYFPKWFRSAYREVQVAPPPPPKMVRGG